MLNANIIVGTHDILFVTLDTLRYDSALQATDEGMTPNLARWMEGGQWERRHTPGNFTYSAHHAFFGGFLPTPDAPGPHHRLFAVKFEGSETINENTCVFEASNIVEGFAARGYATICIGGVGFFNKKTPMSCVLPGFFQHSYWSDSMGVTDPRSTENQVSAAIEAIDNLPDSKRAFLFLNISAIHQPNNIYSDSHSEDNQHTQALALQYVDTQMPRLIEFMQRRAPLFCIFCSDHGTAYGDDGYYGHRLSHPVVWTVPYYHFTLPQIHAGDQ